MKEKKNTQLIVALDTNSGETAEDIVKDLKGMVKYFKVGSQLFTACGPKVVDMIHKHKARVFLDLKFHDIPHTVAQAARNALRLGVFMFNVHAMGGAAMLEELIATINKEIESADLEKPLILGVTVLTSMDRSQLNSVGVMRSVKNEVIHLARICQRSGLDGVVCSGKEIKLLRRVMGNEFILVVPGIRPSTSPVNDQKRIVMPQQAANWGADYIVVGRPITAAGSPQDAAEKILKELE
ncbi:MAG: orotidine-5'-phosphate decarboxylase [Candidatus Omnitrophota bacterium]